MVVHYSKGYIPTRKVRIALTLQLGKWIIKDDAGRLCFFAGRGHSKKTPENEEEKKKKKDEDDESEDEKLNKEEQKLANLFSDKVKVITSWRERFKERINKKIKDKRQKKKS